MKKIITILFSLFLLSSCSEDLPESNETATLNESIEVSKAFLKRDLISYNEKCFSELIEKIDKESGFLGWRNIRDYFGMGSQSYSEKITVVWNEIYDNNYVNNLYITNISELTSGTRLNYNDYIIQIPKDNQVIKLYSHKIGLSTGLLIIELIIESFILYWLAYGIAFVISFIIASTTGNDASQSGCFIFIIVGIVTIIGMLIFYYTEDYSQEKLKEKLIEKNVEIVLEKTNNSYTKINNDYTKYKN
ncbi:hypothetical protein G1K75_12500 [Tenacibaculum finnmarkense]|nr:hypothetical protein [Tenacibaculum finnmarkense]MBE7693698.1 hypothetical protein [Tenacibaculum finnmarkense genomovar finnmarkense]MCG8806471.1 hypothetical protein [Tenacibaculum finnmarkense]MCG8857597.1 hypothetical protein [Tenacibaculum finnmarkense]